MLPRADRVRYDEASADLRQHDEATDTRGLEVFDRSIASTFTGTVSPEGVDGRLVSV
jgi:hypothetical protein